MWLWILIILPLSASSPHREKVREELARLQGQTGSTLVYFDHQTVLKAGFTGQSWFGEEIPLNQPAQDGVVSHDGQRIALLNYGGSLEAHLSLVGRNGKDLHEFREIRNPGSLCWSRDNSKLVMSTDDPVSTSHPPARMIQLLDTSTLTRQPLQSVGSMTSQCFSPDDRQIVYDDNRDSIRILDLSSRQSREIARGTYPSWSPDGNWIAFLDHNTFYAVKPSGDGRKLLFKAKHPYSGLTWSPDSRFVAYTECCDFSWKLMFEFLVTHVRRLEDGADDWVGKVPNIGKFYGSLYQWVQEDKR